MNCKKPGTQNVKPSPTKRAADGLDYARFSSSFLASSFFRSRTESTPGHPPLCAPFVRAPTLLMVAPEDEMVHANYAVARQAYELIPGPKQWYDIAGGHFGLLYYPSELFD